MTRHFHARSGRALLAPLSALGPSTWRALPARALRLGPTRWTTLVALVSAAVLFTGCASPGPDHAAAALRSPAELGLQPAASGATTAAPPALTPGWGDPALDQLLQQALQGQPSLAVARARWARAQALAGLSEAANGPQAQLSLDLAHQRYTENGLVPPPVAGNTFNSATVQAGLSWSPDFFGQHAAELAAALGQARAAQADAAAAESALVAQLSRSYVGLARLLARREVAGRALAQREEILGLTRQRVAAGLDTRVELTQAEGALPDARQQLEALDELITLARHQLAALSGQAPQALATLSPRLEQLQAEALPPSLSTDLLGRRPDVLAARWRVEAALQEVGAARAQFYPSVNLSAFVGLNALGLDQWLQAGSRQLGVAPALRLPLFDGGRLRSQLGARQAEADAAIGQYNAVVIDAVREASDALGSLESLARQQREQAAALASAQLAHDLALQRFRAGLGSYLLVLNTESQWLAQRRLAVDLQARQLDTRAQLVKALGGGWAERPLPAPTASL